MGLTNRDKAILNLLKHFRVLSRDQLATLTCSDLAKPYATINRIMKRLSRDSWATTIPRPKDEQYLYMPNPSIVSRDCPKTKHYLGLVDTYIRLNRPQVFEIEPKVNASYFPDIYTRIPEPIVIEYQRSRPSSKKVMQDKIDKFVEAHQNHQHDAKTLWILTPKPFDVTIPEGYTLVQKDLS